MSLRGPAGAVAIRNSRPVPVLRLPSPVPWRGNPKGEPVGSPFGREERVQGEPFGRFPLAVFLSPISFWRAKRNGAAVGTLRILPRPVIKDGGCGLPRPPPVSCEKRYDYQNNHVSLAKRASVRSADAPHPPLRGTIPQGKARVRIAPPYCSSFPRPLLSRSKGDGGTDCRVASLLAMTGIVTLLRWNKPLSKQACHCETSSQTGRGNPYPRPNLRPRRSG